MTINSKTHAFLDYTTTRYPYRLEPLFFIIIIIIDNKFCYFKIF